jgi:glutathione S-transferase
MITLHTFGPMFGLPDPSPFVTKADVLLKMSGLPYKTVIGDLRKAPKGKLPYIEDDGKVMGDSTLMRLHLEQRYGIDFDKPLSAAEKGIAWSVEKLLEDHLYWAMLSARWLDDRNFDKGPRHFFDAAPALIRPLIVAMVRRKVRGNLHAQGLGRHSDAEVVAMAVRAVDAVAAILGDRPYLMGAQACGADATVFAFVAGILAPHFDTALRTHTEKHRNLAAYCDRMLRAFYPAG